MENNPEVNDGDDVVLGPSEMPPTPPLIEQNIEELEESPHDAPAPEPTATPTTSYSCGFMTEKIFGNGQDSEPFWHVWQTETSTRTLIAVFDGMGGAGAGLVQSLDDESSMVPMAYIASRVARESFSYVCNQVTPSMSPIEIKVELEKRVLSQLSGLLERPGGEPSTNVRGTIVSRYPTTIAAALVEETAEGRRVYVFWAGDSRVYSMTDEPEMLLQQLSIDHNGSDNSSDGGDAALTNFASPEKVDLELLQFDLPKNSIVIAATDGCFGYSSSQYLVTSLIESMDRSRNQDEFVENLKRDLSRIAGDDCSFVACFSPAFTFDDAREMFSPYLRELQDIRLVPKENRFVVFSNDDYFRKLLNKKAGS